MKLLLIQNCPVEGFGHYAEALEARDLRYDVVHPYRGDRLPAWRRYDAFLVGGTPDAAYEVHRHPYLRRVGRYLGALIDAGCPVLGICCGGQLLAHRLGAAVRRNPQPEIGSYVVHLTDAGRRDPLMQSFPDTFPVFHWHGDTFDVPAGARLLASGDACRNQLFRHGRTVAVQFHLEVSGDEAERWADAYPDELAATGLTREALVAACRRDTPRMAPLATRLLDNFLGL